jgi:hypothetical protein
MIFREFGWQWMAQAAANMRFSHVLFAFVAERLNLNAASQPQEAVFGCAA